MIPELISKLDTCLDVSDKVSLTFLLFEYDLMRNAIQQISSTFPLLKYWYKTNYHYRWRGKVCEALLLIQNFRALKAIGVDQNVLKKIIGNNKEKMGKSFLSPERIELFGLIEDLSIEESRILIDKLLLSKSIDIPSCLLSPHYIEAFLILWLSQHGANLVSLRLLNEIISELPSLPNEVPCFNNSSLNIQSSNISECLGNVDISSQKDLLPSTSGHSKEFNDSYTIIDPKEVGLVVIVNQMFASDNVNLALRRGADKDCEMIERIMQKKNFICQKIQDPDHNQMLPAIQNTVRKYFKKNHSILMVVIMSHGAKDVIYCSDGEQVHSDAIRKYLSDVELPILKDRPKIIVFQACRGDTLFMPQTRVESDGAEDVSNKKCGASLMDYIICWPTLPGFRCYRDPEKGSWYITCLFSCIDQFQNLSFETILKKVALKFKESEELAVNVKDMSTVSKKIPKHLISRMMPEYISGLTKELYLSAKQI